LSSRNPNLQNIPRGKTIKRFFIAEEGNVFVNADYNQLEARVVCCEAKEESLRTIFSDPTRDIFWEFAREEFGPDATPGHRQIYKRVVHGTNYGMGPQTMADQMNSDAELFGLSLRYDKMRARKLQDRYFRIVPGLTKWQDSVKREIFESHNDLVTPFGRHRRFWLITRENKKDIEHEGIAFKPQSIASDICLRALVECHRRGIQLRLTVHDSLLAECAEDQAQDVAREMEQVMLASAAEYSTYCKFAVEIGIGKSWADV
jgi:DNA polymerase-1